MLIVAVILILALALVLPLVLRLIRAAFVAHLWAVVLFLPAGLVLRLGRNESMAVFILVTIVWGTTLAAWRVRRRYASHRR